MPSQDETERSIEAGPADVLLCHDYPSIGYELPSADIPEKDKRASFQVAEMLAKVVESIEPKLVVHGHWHRRYSIERRGVRIEGLDRDTTSGAVTLLDLDTLEVEDWPVPAYKHQISA